MIRCMGRISYCLVIVVPGGTFSRQEAANQQTQEHAVCEMVSLRARSGGELAASPPAAKNRRSA